MLVRWLKQNGGILSKRARDKEFPELKNDEVVKIESTFMKFLKFDGSKILIGSEKLNYFRFRPSTPLCVMFCKVELLQFSFS